MSEKFKNREKYLDSFRQQPTEETKDLLLKEKTRLKQILQEQNYARNYNVSSPEMNKRIKEDLERNEKKLSMLKATLSEIQQILKDSDTEKGELGKEEDNDENDEYDEYDEEGKREEIEA